MDSVYLAALFHLCLQWKPWMAVSWVVVNIITKVTGFFSSEYTEYKEHTLHVTRVTEHHSISCHQRPPPRTPLQVMRIQWSLPQPLSMASCRQGLSPGQTCPGTASAQPMSLCSQRWGWRLPQHHFLRHSFKA